MKKVDSPKHKKDWIGKQLLLKRGWEPGRCTPPDGIAVKIYRRLHALETLNCGIDVSGLEVRIIKVSWTCPHCGASHQGYIPERWIEEGEAFFVEK